MNQKQLRIKRNNALFEQNKHVLLRFAEKAMRNNIKEGKPIQVSEKQNSCTHNHIVTVKPHEPRYLELGSFAAMLKGQGKSLCVCFDCKATVVKTPTTLGEINDLATNQ